MKAAETGNQGGHSNDEQHAADVGHPNGHYLCSL